jgi:hypothetical protein
MPQLSLASLQPVEHVPAAAHGSPAWTEHAPEAQESAPLQNEPSLHDAVLAV